MNLHSAIAGDFTRRSLLPNHETADRQSEPIERRARLGTDVALEWTLRLQSSSDERADAFLAYAASSHRARLDSATSKNAASWSEKVSSTSG